MNVLYRTTESVLWLKVPGRNGNLNDRIFVLILYNYADTAGEKSMKIPNSCSILSSWGTWKLFLNFRFSLSTFNRVYHGVYNKRRQTVQKLTVFNIFDPVIYRFWWSFNVTLDGNILFKRWANELIPNIYYGMNYGHENSTSNKQ